MKTLGLDTALGACSAAIADGNEIIASRWLELSRGHAEQLLDLVGEVEREAGLCVKEMDRLAVTIGPGTFTGLRVGLSAAKGMRLSSGCPLIGINTLQVVALGLERATLKNQMSFVLPSMRAGERSTIKALIQSTCPFLRQH